MIFHKTRKKPKGSVETFSGKKLAPSDYESFPIDTEDFGMVMLHLGERARGAFTVSQMSAGSKNHFAFEIFGTKAGVAWNQEQPDTLWVGHRNEPNQILIKDASLFYPEAAGFADLPGGHSEGYDDSHKQIFKRFYAKVADPSAPVEYPTFEDGLQRDDSSRKGVGKFGEARLGQSLTDYRYAWWRRPLRLRFLLSLLLASLPSQSRTNKQTAIDEYCQRLRAEFVETQPDIFRGPNPWVQLERPPGRVLEGSLALVYAEGSQTRWVQLLIEGPHHEWSQTVNYFYGTDNRLVKRERYLDQVPANTTLEELLYYENGRIFSKASRHHPLKTGREDHSQFDDPNAPEFGSVEELPFPEDADAEWPLAMRDL